MKKTFTLLVTILLTTNIFANELHHSQVASLFDHMTTVNEEWKAQSNLPDEMLSHPVSFNSDTERIQTHLQLVSKILTTRDHQLSTETNVKRKENLKSLVSYWQEGRFPINTGHDKRQPYFIDNFGTACAVGHLLQTSGEEALAKRISLEQNFAYIRELEYSELGNWATINGFTEEELAWIQPGYPSSTCYDYATPAGVWNPSGNAVVNVMKENDNGLLIAGNFTFNNSLGTIKSVTMYDGFQYAPLPIDIVGTIHDIEVQGSEVYLVGDFEIPGTNFKNIIKTDYLNNWNWTGLQSGDMNGAIQNLEIVDCNLFISGTFTAVNGQSKTNIAAYSLTNNSWNDQPISCGGVQYPDNLSTNNQINDILAFNNQLVVGGIFTQVGSSASNLAPDGLAFYDENGWTPAVASNSSNPVSYVDHLIDFDGHLLIGADDIHYYDNQVWQSPYAINFPGSFCAYFVSGPYDDLFTIESAQGKSIFYRKGQETRMFNSTPEIYAFTTLGINVSSGMLKTGALFGANVYLGGDFTGTSIYSSQGCGVSYDCTTPMNVQNSGQLLTFDLVLPIELADFSGTLYDGGRTVQLDWTTLSESEIDRFVVERSIVSGNLEFEAIGEVKAAGESSTSVSYGFKDDISSILAPNIYYRLKILDNSGAVEYSDVIVIHPRIIDQPIFSLYPNPSTGMVRMDFKGASNEDQITLSVYDVQGKLLEQENLRLNGSFLSKEFDFSHLRQGLYMVRVTDSAYSYTLKLQLF